MIESLCQIKILHFNMLKLLKTTSSSRLGSYSDFCLKIKTYLFFQDLSNQVFFLIL